MGRAIAVRDYGGVSAGDRQADRRLRLLRAGRQLWGTAGSGDVTVRGVCAQAGLGPRYFYEQFPDRDALLLAVADQVRDELLSVLVSSALDASGGLGDKLRAGLKAFLDLIADDPHIHRIVSDVLTSGGALADRRRDALDTVTALVLAHGPGIVEVGAATPADLRRNATFIVGGVHQLIDAWVINREETTAELADICTALCLAVVRSAAARG